MCIIFLKHVFFLQIDKNFRQMASNDNKYNGPERRVRDRRKGGDRRTTVRFGDVLGRRSGIERRVAWKPEKAVSN